MDQRPIDRSALIDAMPYAQRLTAIAAIRTRQTVTGTYEPLTDIYDIEITTLLNEANDAGLLGALAYAATFAFGVTVGRNAADPADAVQAAYDRARGGFGPGDFDDQERDGRS